MAFEAKPNSCGLFENTKNDRSDLTGQIQIECPRCHARLGVVGERVAQFIAERARLHQPRPDAEVGKMQPLPKRQTIARTELDPTREDHLLPYLVCGGLNFWRSREPG
jgi:hypothetical protein